MSNEQPMATVERLDDGTLLLNDPVAVSIWQALSAPDLLRVYESCKDRVDHFVQRMKDLNYPPELKVIVLLSVDDSVGGMITEALMPGANWQEYRDRGEEPYARGMATREPIRKILEVVYPDVAQVLARNHDKTCVVVVSHSSAAIFDALSHTQLT